MPLSNTRWIVVRKNRHSGDEFFDWDTLSWWADEALKRAKADNNMIMGYARDYPIVRVAQGEFSERAA